MHCSSSEKLRKQGKVIGGKRLPPFRMPHHAKHRACRMLDSLDDSILGNSPSREWRENFRSSEIMKAVHFHALAIDRNSLTGSHMAMNLLQSCTEAMLNHLHPPANAQNGQVAALGYIEKGAFGGVALGSIAAVRGQIVATGEYDAVDFFTDCQRGLHGIGDGNRSQPALQKKFYPDLVETIAARVMRRVD